MSKKVVVIGAGPGGYTAAFKAADMGMEVTMIEASERLGGVCLNVGCIPTKALLHVEKVLSEADHAAEMGIEFSKPKIDISKVREFKEGVVKKLTGGLTQLSKQRKVNIIKGFAKFTDSHTLEVDLSEGGKEQVGFDYCIIATGTQSTKIPGLSIDSERVMDNISALAINDIPKKLLVIGAGYIGLEMATIYKGLGSEVSIVEVMPNFMSGIDPDIVRIYRRYNKDMFTDEMLETKVKEVKEKKNGLEVTFEDKEGKTFTKEYDKVLLSIGRTPLTKNMGLDNTKVKVDQKGFIEIDESCRTADDNILAIGDVTGGPLLAHRASAQAHVAVEVIEGKKAAFEPKVIPAVLFTNPEIAAVGLTEEKAKEIGKEVTVTRFPWAASGRAMTLARTEGMTKLIIDPETERILGISIIGVDAGKLISEGALAIEMGALASDLALTIHPHPTLSETLMEAAEMFYGSSTHVYKPKRK